MKEPKTFEGNLWHLFKVELRRYDWKDDYPLWTVVTIMAAALALVNPIALILIPIVVFLSLIRCIYRAYKRWTARGPPFYFP